MKIETLKKIMEALEESIALNINYESVEDKNCHPFTEAPVIIKQGEEALVICKEELNKLLEPEDALLFLTWVCNIQDNAGQVATAIAKCSTPDDYRSAIKTLPPSTATVIDPIQINRYARAYRVWVHQACTIPVHLLQVLQEVPPITEDVTNALLNLEAVQ